MRKIIQYQYRNYQYKRTNNRNDIIFIIFAYSICNFVYKWERRVKNGKFDVRINTKGIWLNL